MRALILACLFSFFAASAFASGQNATVFPPSDCVAGTESVLSTYYGGGSDFSSTKCKTGQDVMKLAIPNCGEDQQVVFQSGAFKGYRRTKQRYRHATGSRYHAAP